MPARARAGALPRRRARRPRRRAARRCCGASRSCWPWGARPWIAPIPGLESASFLTSDDLLHLTDLPALARDRRRRPDRRRVRAGPQPPRRRGHARAAQRLAAARRGARGARDAAARAAARGRPRRHRRQAHQLRATCRAAPRCPGSAAASRPRRCSSRPGASRASTSPTPPRPGIALLDGGARVDAHLATTARGIWALGDAIGGDHRRFQFTHVATYEGPQVAENALRGAHHEPGYLGMPRVTFTDPEVAAVGLTEAEARERGIDAHTQRQARARGRQGARRRRDARASSRS